MLPLELYRKVHGILKKLACQRLETSVKQVKDLDINTEEKLNLVVDLIFEEAIVGQNCDLYANMCKQLITIRVPSANNPLKMVSFSKLLLTKCQKEFERDGCEELKQEERMKAIESADPDKKRKLQLEYDEEEKKMRCRQLGNTRFIGELFKLNMLTESLIHECVKLLLIQGDEEYLACLCLLLKRIGKELHDKRFKSQWDVTLDQYFEYLQRIVDRRLTSSRVRFILQDVIDLKKIKVPVTGNPSQMVNFKELLPTKCQKEFEQDRCGVHIVVKQEERIKDIESADPENCISVSDLCRKLHGILKKLTRQKFEISVKQVKGLDINTEEKLNGVVDLIFETATDGRNCVLHANMCKHLITIKVPSAENPSIIVNFRKRLLTKCQKEFERDRCEELKREERMKAIESADPDKKRDLQLEYDKEEKKMRKRQVGNIRFIGELFKLNMLTVSIMHECIRKLLIQGDEESLECVYVLLRTIGKKLDDEGSKSQSDCPVDQYFAQLQRIVDRQLISSRVSFMLQDVIHLKKNNWVTRRGKKKFKTIDRIRKEAEMLACAQQAVHENMSTHPK